MSTTRPPTRLPALDGIRGIAIALVLLSHTTHPFGGGFLGVDVFFVLSGYLITTLLRSELESTRALSLSRFYSRRALRLFPALIAMLLLVVLIARITGGNMGSERLVVAMPAVLLYVANWLQAIHHVGLGFLAHTWSLSIEEQFYLTWPAAVAVLTVRSEHPRRWLVGGIVATFLFRLGLSFFVSSGLDDWTIVRTDGLMLGALISYLSPRQMEALARTRSWSPWLSLGVLLALVLVLDRLAGLSSMIALRGGYTLASVASAIMVGQVVVAPPSWFTAAMAAAPLRILGRVSYGVYLYHFPILQACFQNIGGWPGIVIGYSLLIVVVTASWLFLETPALRLKDRVPVRWWIGHGRVAEAGHL